VPVGLPERARLACGGHREPAAERTFDIRPQVFFLEQELDEFLALGLVLGVVKISPVLTSERYLIGVPSGLLGNEAVMMVPHTPSCRRRAVPGSNAGLLASSSHFAAIEIVKLCVITMVLLWNATLLSGSFQVVKDYTDTCVGCTPISPPGRTRTTIDRVPTYKTIVMTHNFTISDRGKVARRRNNPALTPNSAPPARSV